jgi:transposase
MVMTVKNKYINRSKISEKKFGGYLRLFAVDLDATQIAHVTGLNRNTI